MKKMLAALLVPAAVVLSSGDGGLNRNYAKMSCGEIAESVNSLEELQDFFDKTFVWTSDMDVYGVSHYVAPADAICNHRRSDGIFVDDCDASFVLGARFLNKRPRGLLLYYYRVEGEGDDKSRSHSHAVFLDERDGKFGTAGVSRRDYRDYEYWNVEALCKSFAMEGHELSACAEFDVSRQFPDYISACGNMRSATDLREVLPAMMFFDSD